MFYTHIFKSPHHTLHVLNKRMTYNVKPKYNYTHLQMDTKDHLGMLNGFRIFSDQLYQIGTVSTGNLLSVFNWKYFCWDFNHFNCCLWISKQKIQELFSVLVTAQCIMSSGPETVIESHFYTPHFCKRWISSVSEQTIVSKQLIYHFWGLLTRLLVGIQEKSQI